MAERDKKLTGRSVIFEDIRVGRWYQHDTCDFRDAAIRLRPETSRLLLLHAGSSRDPWLVSGALVA